MNKKDWLIEMRDGVPYRILYKNIEFATIHRRNFEIKYGIEGLDILQDALDDLFEIDVEEKPSDGIKIGYLESEEDFIKRLRSNSNVSMQEAKEIARKAALHRDLDVEPMSIPDLFKILHRIVG